MVVDEKVPHKSHIATMFSGQLRRFRKHCGRKPRESPAKGTAQAVSKNDWRKGYARPAKGPAQAHRSCSLHGAFKRSQDDPAWLSVAHKLMKEVELRTAVLCSVLIWNLHSGPRRAPSVFKTPRRMAQQ